MMSYDDEAIGSIRRILAPQEHVVEKRIVGGGLGFMVNGHLCCGTSSRGLTVRVGKAPRAAALAETHVGPLRIGKREPSAFVLVEPAGYREDDALERWVARGLRFIESLE